MNDQIKKKQDYHPKLTGGLVLILLGVLFLLAEMDRVPWADWWAWFLVGLGAIFLLEALLRAFSAEDRCGISGRLTAGFILAIIGGSHLLNLMGWWPLILIAVGIVVLVSAFLKK